jgi:hypothetical protein
MSLPPSPIPQPHSPPHSTAPTPSSVLSTLLLPQHYPFLLHALIELPAALQFLLLPSRQLPSPAPQSHALIRQYALLLFSSVFIALAFAFPAFPTADGEGGEPLETMILRSQVAAALALYHIGPIVRSVGRLKGRWRRGKGVVLCEPGLYLVVHLVVGGELGRCAVRSWRW